MRTRIAKLRILSGADKPSCLAFGIFTACAQLKSPAQEPYAPVSLSSATAPLRVEEDATRARLRQRYVVTNAGNRVLDVIWDTKFNTPCEFRLGTDQVLRCLPTTAHGSRAGRAYRDPLCQKTILQICSPTAETPPLAVIQTGPSRDKYEYLQIGLPLTNPQVFQKGPAGSCSPRLVQPKPKDGCRYYEESIRLQESAFVGGRPLLPLDGIVSTPLPSPADNVGFTPARITRRVVELPEGGRLDLSTWDNWLSIPCTFMKGTDGLLRCYPAWHSGTSALPFSYYLDSKCSSPVLFLSTKRVDEVDLVRWMDVPLEAPWRPLAPDELFYGRIGRRLSRGPIYTKGPRCHQVDFSDVSRYHKPGAALKPEDFAIGIGYEFGDLPHRLWGGR